MKITPYTMTMGGLSGRKLQLAVAFIGVLTLRPEKLCHVAID